MTPSAARAATSACLASAADGPTNVIDICLAGGAPYALIRNACGGSTCALRWPNQRQQSNSYYSQLHPSNRTILTVLPTARYLGGCSLMALWAQLPVATQAPRRICSSRGPGLRRLRSPPSCETG